MTRPLLFPVVELVRVIGISWPAEKTAKAIQNRIGWHPEAELEKAPSRGGASLTSGWAALTADRSSAAERSPEDPSRWSAGR